MANESSTEHKPGDNYKAMRRVFCDGFNVCLGELESSVVLKSKSTLEDAVQTRATSITIKNMLIKVYKGKTNIWFTLTKDTSEMSSKTMTQLTQVIFAIKKFAREWWRLAQTQLDDIDLNKVDFAVDCKGAFLPKKDKFVF